MSSLDIKSAERPAPDQILTAIADYALNYDIKSPLAFETAAYCLMDTLACGFQALKYPACTQAPGSRGPGCRHGRWRPRARHLLRAGPGARPRSTSARWCAGWTSTTPGLPQSGAILRITLGGILAVADYQARLAVMSGKAPLDRARRAHRHDQGARDPGHPRAREQLQPRRSSTTCCWCAWPPPRSSPPCSAARVEQVTNAVSNAWIDGGALRTYRHAPNTGSRKSWAAGRCHQPRRASWPSSPLTG